jgi:hypothetical protein
MFRFCFCALVTLVVSYLNAEEAVLLKFNPKVPVSMTSTHAFDFKQSVLGVDIAIKGQQSVDSTLEILAREKALNKDAGFLLAFMLKDFRLAFNFNDRKINFNARDNNRTLISAEVSRWLDKPIELVTTNENRSLKRESDQLENLMKRYPNVGSLDPYKILEGLILPIFSLADKELKQGAKIELNDLKGIFGVALSSIQYEIVAITPEFISARYNGTISPQEMILTDFLTEGADDMPLLLSFKGSVEGNSRWNRNNALICEMTGDYSYNSVLKMGNIEWPVSITIKSDVKTTELKP